MTTPRCSPEGSARSLPTSCSTICLNNGIKHILTAPYSPTTTGKVERLHKTMRKEFFSSHSFQSIEQAQELDGWVTHYNHDREHQAIGDVPLIRRFELAEKATFEVIDGEVAMEQEPQPRARVVSRRVDRAGRISILKHRYHVGRYLAGQAVTVESHDGLLHVSHNGVVVATHARRHLVEDDDRMDRRPKASRPARPTKGDEVLRKVDSQGSVSFAGTCYRVANRHRGQTVGVRLVGDTFEITQYRSLLRTHRARHDRSKEFGALSKPYGKPRRTKDLA
ncbi:MAG: integrase core domain-containing protein [Acidimicrobiia bacterium]